MQLDQARGHHDQIGEHLIGAKQIAQCADELPHMRRPITGKLVVRLCGGVVPMPGILKCMELRIGF